MSGWVKTLVAGPDVVTGDHVLVVRDPGESYASPLDCHEWADWEIRHPDDCPTEVVDHDDAGVPVEEHRCGVAYHEEYGDIRWNLRYSGTPVDVAGEYVIEAWSSESWTLNGTEYDAGLYVVEAP